ncbi:hydroxysqualene dehydroxylase [Mucilaginibacter arboris]|uniref:FAD-dependent oxidoreductase n=1 Tax=Mucilaginibacter arboris TaxID=2682090 RepID=A0A7K1SVE5_9SPHI|nr:FAD-dependent oxidoreductase [Mucilaginibacter arboris]MVN21208.1 FAD-dependent oxidoreductase [Mucilaginibacter arboris]
MAKRVIILGGGIAGMSAAHELVERGFEVEVLERHKQLPGGKARSTPISDLPTENRQPLPGEHGFRFFPGFYRHITDTMKRIPFKNNPNGVYDNLIECSRIMMARMGQTPIYAPGNFPRSFSDLLLIIHDIFHTQSGLSPGESKVIAKKVWQLMTSCEERRTNEYEHIGWWEFTEADKYSESYRTLFVNGLTRTLVAAKAEKASTKTGGDIFLQLLFNMANPSVRTDRILCGPTNDVWLFPWLEYLKGKGVGYHFDQFVEYLEFENGTITGVCTSSDSAGKQKFTGDYYLCALPVERAAKLMQYNPEIYKLDTCLDDIATLANDVAWMNGIQFYLLKDVSINKGHIILADSPWALTAISQIQFWKDFDISQYGTGDVRGIISVDVSNWDVPGLIYNKPAKDCSQKEVIAEVWEQMKQSFNRSGEIILEDSNLKCANIDCDIIFRDDVLDANAPSVNGNNNQPIRFGTNSCDKNEEPLLVNEVDTWVLRRETYTDIPNLFLASDYIKTNTDLATMEGANEAARRAVNNIIDRSGKKVPFCKVWKLHEPDWLLYYKWLDRRRYRKGLAWKINEPLLGRFLNSIFSLFKKAKNVTANSLSTALSKN